jgi:hypothetical protein
MEKKEMYNNYYYFSTEYNGQQTIAPYNRYLSNYEEQYPYSGGYFSSTHDFCPFGLGCEKCYPGNSVDYVDGFVDEETTEYGEDDVTTCSNCRRDIADDETLIPSGDTDEVFCINCICGKCGRKRGMGIEPKFTKIGASGRYGCKDCIKKNVSS